MLSASRVASRWLQTKSAGKISLDEASVKQLRKDYLLLTKNVKRINRDPKRLGRWRQAMRVWGDRYGEFGSQIRDDLQGRIRTNKYKPAYEQAVNLEWAQYYLDHMEPFWNLNSELSLRVPRLEYKEPEPLADVRKRLLELPGQTEYDVDRYLEDAVSRGRIKTPESAMEAAWDKWEAEAVQWDARTKRKARAAWKYLQDLASWAQRGGLAGGGAEAIELVSPTVENANLEGFQIQFIGFPEAEDYLRSYLPALKAGLSLFRQRAGRVFPWMLQHMLPLQILWAGDGEDRDAAAVYNHTHIRITGWGVMNKPGRIVHILAHEMGHHVFQKFLSGKQTKDWTKFIRGDYKELDLRKVLSQMKPNETTGRFGERIEREDPILHLQLETLYYNPVYTSRDLASVRGIREYLEEGGNPLIQVPTHPITGYAAKNPEEAFCEALGKLVAYGPKSLPKSVTWWMKQMLPNLRLARSHRQAGAADDLKRKVKKLIQDYEAAIAIGPDWARFKAIGTPFADWFTDTFRVEVSLTPRGGKALKAMAQRFLWTVRAGVAQQQSTDMLKRDWAALEAQLPTLVAKFSDEGSAQGIKEIKTPIATYRNDRGLSTKVFQRYVQSLDQLFSTLKGWRRKALRGGFTVALAGPKAFRGTSAGRYNAASDTLFVRATPKVMKRSPGKYGSPDYILIHELGHRYDHKEGTTTDFDRQQWHTTRYSRAENMTGLTESFAELFALGHFGMRSVRDEFGEVVDRFESLMSGG